MQQLLWVMEGLARYGVFDIVFGLGILQYLRVKLRGKRVKSIDGVEVRRRFNESRKEFEIQIVNLTERPLYVFRVYFDPTYLRGKGLFGAFYYTNSRDFPRISSEEMRTVKGQYLLEPHDASQEPLKHGFLGSSGCLVYRIGLENWEFGEVGAEELIAERKCGSLEAHVVHGDQTWILEVDL